VLEQYKFARDNIDSIRRIIPGEKGLAGGEENYLDPLLEHFNSFVKRLFFLMLTFVVLVLVFRNVTIICDL
jgi:hypothetical protein